MMAKYLIAHDLGTTGNKATLFNTEGKLIKSVTYSYKTNFFNSTWAEQNPEDWWEAVCVCNKKLLENIEENKIAALAFSGQMMGCVIVDVNGKAIRPAIIWADQRSQEQEMYLKSKIEESEFYKITGHKISASYSLEKLMWIRDNEPENYEKTFKMLQPKDYIIKRLTGEFVTDYSDASGTNAFDLNNFMWSEKILNCANISINKLPNVYSSTHVAGVINKEISKESGLPEGCKVVIGGGDGVCAAVGAGSVKENIAYNYLGSSAWIAYTSKKPVYDEQMRTYNWAHMIEGYITPNGTMQAAGNSYNFLRELLFENNKDNYDFLDSNIHNSKIGANGLIYLPYLLGERSPRWNADARGAYIGMKIEHSKGDFLRAGVEGVLMNLSIILDIFRAESHISKINLIGGMAQSEEIQKILADIYGIEINRLSHLEEATSMGAAIAAGVGCGIFEDFSVIDKFIAIEKSAKPVLENHKKYKEIKIVFEKAYQSLLETYTLLKNI